MPILHDWRIALRSLTRTPAFTVTAVLSLGLALGAGAAAFSVIDAVRLRALPFPDGDRLVLLTEVPAGMRQANCDNGCDVSYETFANVLQRRTFQTIDLVAGYTTGGKALNQGGDPIVVSGGVVSPNLFGLLRVSPILGRLFSADDDRVGAVPVVLLSHDLWTSRFNADPGILGQVVKLSDTQYVVIGVMPPGFDHEVRNQFWLPAVPTLDPSTLPSIRSLTAIGRLAPGATLGQAVAELATIDPTLLQSLQHGATIQTAVQALPLRERYTASTRSHDVVFAAIVACIILIAVANLASLVLVRALNQQREFAVRSALGAGSGRLLLVLLHQHAIIVATATVVGLGLARWLLVTLASLDTLSSIRPAGMDYQLDIRVIGFAALLAMVVVAILSLVPGRLILRTDLQTALRDGARSATAGRGKVWTQRVFVVAQIAIAVVLLTAAGLMTRTVLRLSRAELGFDVTNIVSGTPSYPHPWRVPDRYRPVTREILTALEGLPGVARVGLRASVPIAPRGATPTLVLEGDTEPLAASLVPTTAIAVSAGYFATLGIPVLNGREFSNADLDTGLPVAVVNRWAADRWWPGQSAVGHTLRIDTLPGQAQLTLTVIGVVTTNRAAQSNLLVAADRPELYRPYEQASSPFPTFLVRSNGAPAPLLKPMRDLFVRMVPDRPSFASLVSNQVDAQLSRVRINAYQILGFAIVGFALAVMGIYGLLAYVVSRRTQELGVRGALGATRWDLSRIVLVDALWLAIVGLVLGLPVASAAARLIRSLLYGTSLTDPMVYAGIAALVLVVVIAACWIPARRASAVEPVVALRAG
jgi:putative ABC transport system permease protein